MDKRQYFHNLFESLNKKEEDKKYYISFYDAMMYGDYDLKLFDTMVVESVASFGGEGEGDQFYHVYSFDNGEEKIFIKFDGWYASYHGAEFTEWFFVEPAEETIIVYDRV